MSWISPIHRSNQQSMEGVAGIDDAPAGAAVIIDPHLRQNLAMVFAKCFPWNHLAIVNSTLASMFVTPQQIQTPTPQIFSFKIECIASRVVLANIKIPLGDSRSIKDIVTAALKEKKLLSSPDAFKFYGPDNEIINLENMDVNGFHAGDRVTLIVLPIFWSDEKKQIITVVRQNGRALQYASEELRADRVVVLAAVSQHGKALQWASPELRADREVVLAAVRQYGCALASASLELIADREVVLAAVRQYGNALYYARWDFRADRDVVLAAVRQYGNALNHVSEELRADRVVVLAAFSQNKAALYYARKDPVLAIVKQNGEALRYANEKLRADKDVVLAAVRQYGEALVYASAELQIDGDLLLVANPGWISP